MEDKQWSLALDEVKKGVLTLQQAAESLESHSTSIP